jgi:glycosyltransferase involved in cell wall biosynthesis
MKRILYIHHTGGIGGAPLSLLYLIQHLDRTRYEPVVAVLKPGPAADLYRAEGVETHVVQGIDDFSHTTLEWYGGRDLWRLPGKLMRIPGSIARTRTLVERLHPDLVHLNSSTLAPSAIGAARAGVPVVWHIREPLARGYVGLRRAWIRRAVDRCADRVVAISGHDADQLIPSPRVCVIHNFVHFDRFDRSLTGESIRREFDIQGDAPIVAMLGGISEPKGTLTLIRAIPALIEAVPGVRVFVAGPPPHRLDEPGVKGLAKRVLAVDAYPRAVIQAIAELGPEARAALIFAGIRRDVPEILAASACLVFPSTVPHFARPVIEAAAMGVPAVASDLGGPRELIADGETGLLVPPRDPAALAAGIITLLSDPDRARSFGEAAYRRARAMFDAGTNAAATVALYAEILDDRGVTPD